jgi:SSS family solute:Na+ symporter
MSTISSQFHALGTAFSRDIIGVGTKQSEGNKEENSQKVLLITKLGVIIGIIVSVILGYFLPPSIIARGTALFFGVCAAVFLPMYILGLYWKKTSRAAALSGMVVGLVTSVFWMFFVHQANAKMLRLVVVMTGKETLLPAPWNMVDPILIAFPLSFVVTILVTVFSRPEKNEVVDRLFSK